MEELKPCPFCGGVAEIHTRFDSIDSYTNKKSEIPETARFICEKKYSGQPKYFVYRKLYYVPRCTVKSCMGRTIKAFELKREAINAWNGRQPMNDNYASKLAQICKCPVCGKEFVPAPQHAYKIYKNRRYQLVCRYPCMRSWEKENKTKRNSGRRERE